MWKDGTGFRREYVDGIPTGPMETVGVEDHVDGYRVVFDLDQEWLPPQRESTGAGRS